MKVGKLEINFKPEFGNQQHIKVLEMMAVINKNLEILAVKERTARGAGELRNKIRKQYDELERYLSFIKK